jgi:hypothetical protein
MNSLSPGSTSVISYLPSIKASQKIYKYYKLIDSEIDQIYNLEDYKLSKQLLHAVMSLSEYL